MKIKIKDATTRLCTEDVRLAKLVLDHLADEDICYADEAVADKEGIDLKELDRKLDEMLDEDNILEQPKKKRAYKTGKNVKWTKSENTYIFKNASRKMSAILASGKLDRHSKSSIATRRSHINCGKLTREEADKRSN